jgi:hypothetical protein
MSLRFVPRVLAPIVSLTAVVLAIGCGDSDSTGPVSSTDRIVFTTATVHSLDSMAQALVQSNPANVDLKSLVDSTLLVLTAGVEAKRIDVSTNLTSSPLYFVGVHRVFTNSSSSTWSLVGFDDPAHLTNLVEVSGFAQAASGTSPSTVSGTIGSGLGDVNAFLLQVAASGSVTEWRANTGTASFTSDTPGAACPGFTATPKVSCVLETLHARFSVNAAAGTGGATARQASVASTVDVPAMRLTFTP